MRGPHGGGGEAPQFVTTYLGTALRYGLQNELRGAVAQEGMTIGRLAKAAGVNVETVRYYQRRGLVPEPQRPVGGQRRYPPAVLQRLGFIRRAQQLGFSLEEIRRLIELAGTRRSAESRQMAQRKLAVLDSRVEELNAMRRRLRSLVAASARDTTGKVCPVIEALQQDAN